MRRYLLIGCASLTLGLSSCSTLNRADEILAWTQGKIATVEGSIERVDAKIEAKGAEVATLGEQLRNEIGEDELSRDDVAALARKVATTPSLWSLIAAHWDEFLLLLAALGIGGKVAGGTLTVATRKFHATGRKLVNTTEASQ